MTENTLLAQGAMLCADINGLTAQIVSAYVSNNSVPKTELADLIASVRAAISSERAPVAAADIAPTKPTAAQIRKSITPDGLISFIDGKSYKTIKRHLKQHGLTPEAYREKYGLGVDYPMVASSYSAARSKIAKDLQLGVPMAARAA